MLLGSLNDDSAPSLEQVLAVKGLQLDKSHAPILREVIFSFRDAPDKETSSNLVRALPVDDNQQGASKSRPESRRVLCPA